MGIKTSALLQNYPGAEFEQQNARLLIGIVGVQVPSHPPELLLASSTKSRSAVFQAADASASLAGAARAISGGVGHMGRPHSLEASRDSSAGQVRLLPPPSHHGRDADSQVAAPAC